MNSVLHDARRQSGASKGRTSMKRDLFAGVAVAAALGMTLSAGQARAADAPAPPTEVGEVVVTGSYIAGTPQNSALPVAVLNAQELARQGSPTVVNIIKTLPATAGIATVNLRGFGAARTLVLFNGRRLAPSVSGAAAGAVDVNLVPTAA